MKHMILKNFIVFEGIDGAGTSTQIKKLVERGNSDGNTRFIATAEPTVGETGKFLRRMLAGEFSVDEKTNVSLKAGIGRATKAAKAADLADIGLEDIRAKTVDDSVEVLYEKDL